MSTEIQSYHSAWHIVCPQQVFIEQKSDRLNKWMNDVEEKG